VLGEKAGGELLNDWREWVTDYTEAVIGDGEKIAI